MRCRWRIKTSAKSWPRRATWLRSWANSIRSSSRWPHTGNDRKTERCECSERIAVNNNDGAREIPSPPSGCPLPTSIVLEAEGTDSFGHTHLQAAGGCWVFGPRSVGFSFLGDEVGTVPG